VKIRFLATVPSQSPDFPFTAGQTIDMPELTRDVRAALVDGRAVRLDEPEAAVMGAPPDVAVQARPKGRGAR